MSKGADGRRPSCLTCEPHTGTPQVGGDARERPSRKTRPVKIPAGVPYTGHRTDACGTFRSARWKGPLQDPVFADARDRQQLDSD